MMIQPLTNETLRTLLADPPGLMLVDVRTQEEYYFLGHIPQATLIPLHELPQRLAELSKNRPLVLICQHGVRSVHACEYLLRAGYTALYNLTNGMAEWDGELEWGCPATTASVAPIPSPMAL